jgi:hypothetical protein
MYRGIGVQIDAPEELLAELQEQEVFEPVRPAPAPAPVEPVLEAGEEAPGDLV